MRMMLKVQMDTLQASKGIQEGRLPSALQSMMAMLKPEAAYFGPTGGVRTAFIVFDMDDPSLLPTITEPLFSMNAHIEVFPVMNQDDLQKGLSRLSSDS